MKHSTKIWLLPVLWLFVSFHTLAVAKGFSGKDPSVFLTGKIHEADATWHVNAPPPPPITGDASVCEGDVEVYTYPATPGYVYIWNVTSGSGTPSGNTFTVTWGSPGPGTVTLIVKDAMGTVVDTQVLPVTIHSKPYPYITASFSPTCKEKKGEGHNPQKDTSDCLVACDSSIVVYSTPLHPGSTYTWTVVGANSFTPSGNTVSVYWGAPGTGLIRVEETNVYGCKNIAEKCVTIIESPDAFFTSIPAAVGGVISICNGQNVQFFDASTGSIASPLMDWFWDFGDGSTSTDKNPSHIFTTGNYTVTMYVENECHCKDSFTVKVVVSADPPPIIYCISTVCANGVDHYSTPSGCPGATYNWSVVGGTITTPMPYGPDIDVQWGSSGPGIVSLQILGCASVCPTTASVVVSIISPTTTISGPNPACQNSVSIYSIPNMPGSVYTWTVTGGFIMSGQGTEQVEVNWFSGTSGTISVTYVNPTLYCSGSASMTVNLRPKFAITGPAVACVGSTWAYTATPGTPAENAAYNWTVTNSSNVVVATFGGSNVYNITWSFGPGVYQITATNASGAFCNSPQSFFVTVADAPPPPTFITGPNPVCPGGSYMYTSAPTIPGTFIQWNVTNGVPVSASGNQLTVTWGGSGPYILAVTQVSMTYPYCPSAPFIDTIDNKLIPAPVYTISGPTPVCNNSIQTYSTSNTSGDLYNWSIGSSTWGSIIAGQNTPSVTVQWNNNIGMVPLNLSVTTCGIVFNSSLNVTLTGAPPPTITGPTSICENVGAVFSTSTPAATYTWNWGDGSPNSFGPTPPAHVYTNPGTYSVTLTVTDAYGCIGTSSTVQLINVKPAPDAFISGGPRVYCPAGSIVNSPLVVTSLLQPGDTVNWYNGMTWVGGGPTYTATSAGSYTAVVTNMFGCSTTSNIINIVVLPVCPTGCPIDPHYLNFTAVKNGCLTFDFFGNISANGRVIGWDFDDPYNPTGSTLLSPSHTYSEPGIYTVIFRGRFPKTGFPGDSCDRDTFMNITVPIKAKFGYEITCGGASNYLVNFLDLSTYVGGHTLNSWTWTFPGGTPSSSTAQNPTGISYPAGSTPLVTLTITSVTGFTCTIQLPVNIPSIPVVNILGPDSVCQGTPAQFTYTATGPVSNWFWDFGDFSSSLMHPVTNRTYSAPTSGNKTVTLIVNDQFGCPRVFTKPIYIHINNVNTTISTSGPTTFCAGQSVTLTANPAGATPLVTYLWNTIDNTSSIVATQTGGYWVEVVDGRGCRNRSATTNVLVNPVPNAMIVGDDEYCYGETTLLSAYQGASYTYQWLINNVPSVSGPTFSQIQAPGTYNFQVIITNTSNGCKDTSAVYPVIVHPLPPIPGVGSAPSPACEGSAVTLTATTGISPYTFNWSTGDVGNSIVVYNAGLYTVTLTDKFGCQSENSVQVYEMPDFSNLLQGCYEFCDTADVTLVGPVGIGWTYQWYYNGLPIPGPTGTMKDLVIPVGSSGIYKLEITTGFPAYCTDISGPIDVKFIPCKPCHADWRFRDITCVIDSNGTQVYYFTLDWFNPYGPGATYNITTPGGYITGLTPAALVPGMNTINGFFIDVPPANNPFCITGTLYYGEKERCFMKETCIDLPRCEPPKPCEAGTQWLSVVCAGLDANGNPQYYFDYSINWPGGNGSPILSITTANGTLTNLSINDINNGSNILSGIFTSTDGSGVFCFEMYVFDPSTGRVCFIRDCIDVPKCGNVGDCSRRTIRLNKISCDGFDINGNQTYKIDFGITNPFASNATIYFTSPDGGLSGFSPNNIPPGLNGVTGLFTDLAPSNSIICVTVLIVEDATGKSCKQTICIRLPICNDDGTFAGLNSIDDANSGNSILVNPNPAKEQTVISYTFTSGSNHNITITDMYGRTVKVFNVIDDKGTITLPTSTYNAGVYLVSGFSDNKLVDSRRLIIIK